MYSNIVDIKTGKLHKITSKLGKKILKKYIGGAKTKYYISSDEPRNCKQLINSNSVPKNISSGIANQNLTLLEKITFFYSYILNTIETEHTYIYPDLKMCELLLKNNVETPAKFKVFYQNLKKKI